ncbi:MAG: hypothetical protein M0Z30_11445 [Actinomycetota bacterium]|nr:hypothetical protein [Actinomycetota bacterium]
MLESADLARAPYRGTGYEWVSGTARFAADPDDPANHRIVDLARAPRGPDGRVRFSADVRILRPADTGNGRLLVVVPNRGLLGGVPFSLGAPPAFGPTEDPDPGDRFLLQQGWTVAWCGWQWDVIPEPGRLGLDAPLAAVDPGPMRVEFRPDTAQETHPLSDSSPFSASATTHRPTRPRRPPPSACAPPRWGPAGSCPGTPGASRTTRSASTVASSRSTGTS